jgi:hypothetical protein
MWSMPSSDCDFAVALFAGIVCAEISAGLHLYSMVCLIIIE